MVNQLQPLAVADLIERIKPHVGSLPEPQRTEIAAPLKLLEDEIGSGSPEPFKLQGLLRSILTIVEGAAGDVIAAGIQGSDYEDAGNSTVLGSYIFRFSFCFLASIQGWGSRSSGRSLAHQGHRDSRPSKRRCGATTRFSPVGIVCHLVPVSRMSRFDLHRWMVGTGLA